MIAHIDTGIQQDGSRIVVLTNDETDRWYDIDEISIYRVSAADYLEMIKFGIMSEEIEDNAQLLLF